MSNSSDKIQLDSSDKEAVAVSDKESLGKMDYSIIIPVYNEEESLDLLLEEISSAMKSLQGSYEIVFVNDGSQDRSLEKMKVFQNQFPEIIRILDLKKRCGQTFGLNQGLKEARGEILITMDADLQNDPADIPRLIEKMSGGYDVVCGWRKGREDPWLKKRLSKLGNVFQRLISGMRIHDVSCTLRAYKRTCAAQLTLEWEGQHRFIPLILSQKGFKIGEIVAHHRKRKFSSSKYTHKRIFKVVVDFFKVLFKRS